MFVTMIEPVRRGGVLAALRLCLVGVFGFLLLGAPCAVQAQSNASQSNPWEIDQTVQSLKNSNTYALWIKHGTTDASGKYSGDTASIWTLDASGHQVKISPTYGPYAGWRASELVPAFDGTLRMAWTMRTGTTVDSYQACFLCGLWMSPGTRCRSALPMART